MARTDVGPSMVIEPVEQRLVTLVEAGNDEVLAARTETSEIYLPSSRSARLLA